MAQPPPARRRKQPRAKPPEKEWQLFPKQLMEIQSRVNELEQLVGDYEALHTELEQLPKFADDATTFTAATPAQTQTPAAPAPRGPRRSSPLEARSRPLEARSRPERASRQGARPSSSWSTKQEESFSLVKMARKLETALQHHLAKQGIGFVYGESWREVFEHRDQVEAKERLTFEELWKVAKDVLRITKTKSNAVTRYELRLFWSKLDPQKTGVVAFDDFIRVMYRIRVDSWRELSEEECFEVLGLLRSSAERWHRSGDNWYKICKEFEMEGLLTYHSLLILIRSRFPGLSLTPEDLPEIVIQGLWKRLDGGRMSQITVREFMVFARRFGPHPPQPQAFSVKKPPSVDSNTMSANQRTVRLDHKKLHKIAHILNSKMVSIYKRRAMHVSIPRDWKHLLTEKQPAPLTADEEEDCRTGSRLHQPQLLQAVRSLLQLPVAEVSEDDLVGLWTHAEAAHGTGEVYVEDFADALYRLEMAPWPDLPTADLEHVIALVNKAAAKWHRAGSNWYKVFRVVFDVSGSGFIGWDILERTCRARFPGLFLRNKDLGDGELKGLWKAMDATFNGSVTLNQFMHFMKKNAGRCSLRVGTRVIKQEEEEAETTTEVMAVKLEPPALRLVVQKVERAFAKEQRRRGNYYGDRVSPVGGDWASYLDGGNIVTYDGFNNVLRRFLAVEETAGLWTHLSGVTEGSDIDQMQILTTEEIQRGCYGLVLAGWPEDFGDSVAMLTKAADRWHHNGSNWFKVFRAVDADLNQTIEYGDLEHTTRSSYPGVGIDKSELSDESLKGLWKNLDLNGSGQVEINEFMVFLRRHREPFGGGGDEQQQQQQLLSPVGGSPVPFYDTSALRPLSRDRLRSVLRSINKALLADFRKRGIHSTLSSSYELLFEETLKIGGLEKVTGDPLASLSGTVNLLTQSQIGASKSQGAAKRIISYREFHYLVRERIKCTVVTDEEAFGLWNFIDDGPRGEVTRAEFQTSLYGLELETWPDYLTPDNDSGIQPELQKVLNLMEAAAEKFYKASGNWFKVFKCVFDSNNSGIVTFEELDYICRALFPGLQIPRASLTDANLKGFWKALDIQRTGKVPVNDLMVFMRRHYQPPPASSSGRHRRRQYVDDEDDDNSEDLFFAGGKLLRGIFSEALALAQIAKPTDLGYDHGISEWAFPSLIRDKLCIPSSKLKDDDLFAIWKHVDPQDSGLIDAKIFLAFAQNPK